MKVFTISERPENLSEYRKSQTVNLAFVTEPFKVETQEGTWTISPDTVDDWDGGYFVAYPTDGTKPYAIAPAFVRSNYVPVEE